MYNNVRKLTIEQLNTDTILEIIDLLYIEHVKTYSIKLLLQVTVL